MKRASWVVTALAITATATATAQPDPQPSPPPGEEPAPRYLFGPEAIEALIDDIAANAPSLEKIAKGTLRRGRRAISIGPTLGAYGAAQPSPGEYDLAATFGLGMELFKIPVLPTRKNFRALVIERAKAKLKQVVIDELRGKELDPLELKAMADAIWIEAAKEILGMENIRSKTIERPRMTLAVEGNYLVSSGTWAARLRTGVGVWKLTMGVSVGAAFTDPETSLFAGGEFVVHFLTSKGARASVVDVFVRGDFEVRNRDVANTDTVVLGVRYLLDLI
jgi:hypothetical protein